MPVEWDSADALLALTDPDGWWNLHRVALDGATINLAPCEEELGGPLWRLGARWFAPLGEAGTRCCAAASSRCWTSAAARSPTSRSICRLGVRALAAADGDGRPCSAAGPADRKAVVARLDLATGELTS